MPPISGLDLSSKSIFLNDKSHSSLWCSKYQNLLNRLKVFFCVGAVPNAYFSINYTRLKNIFKHILKEARKVYDKIGDTNVPK